MNSADPGNTSPSPNRRALWVVLLLAALALAILLVWKSSLAIDLLNRDNRDDIREWMRQSGPVGPLICIGIQFLQVVIFPIPGEITQGAAGYIFGAWEGFLYSLIGIMLGGAFDFVFARLVGRPVINKLMGPRALARVDRLLASRKGRSALFLLFLTPGMPKDAISYGAGLTQIGFQEFMIISGLGRTPALLFSTLFGSQLYERNWFTLALIGVVAVLVTVGFYLFEKGQQKRSGTPEPPATTSGED